MLACIVGVVGYVAFGWRFGGDSSPIAVTVALAAVVLALGREFRARG
ncbi:hypothetical protein [Halobacterium zhouii]|nr:hypothetical protein [Halobacterium zhouii]